MTVIMVTIKAESLKRRTIFGATGESRVIPIISISITKKINASDPLWDGCITEGEPAEDLPWKGNSLNSLLRDARISTL
jgi:hypothetical protein